ncbi:hypothetical protein [Paenibacillus sp. P46E]|uniref:hypothetical protein n=1 Tax=Paenibacillus sp. P46E TaxID=1349436 RepID=UPI00093DA01D|nr:hypothetical protein [Paenibacillus sp. P46E]OKP97742.1 hypothetical protein A3849_13630 [Paenibacillus sp. P46E]
MKLIQDDEQYERAREGLFSIAAELDDPLSGMPDDERKRQNLIYDRTVESVREYRRSELVVTFPGLKQVYERLGFPYRDFSQAPLVEQVKDPEAPASSESVPAPVEEAPVQATVSRLSGWLDD